MATLTTQINAYLYQQYAGDDDVGAFFTAYNQLSQANLDSMNNLALPNYLNKHDDLLNLIGEGLYGEVRHPLAVGQQRSVGMWNTYDYAQRANNQYGIQFSGNAYDVSDSVYIKIIQWNNFKGDGFQFTIRWLKRRVYRFFFGDTFPQETYPISVTVSGTEATIEVPSTYTDALTFQAAVESGTLLLPFQYTFNVVLV